MNNLYELPNGWEWKKLGDVFNIERGGSPRPIKDYITDDKDGINWIKISDATKGDGKYIKTTEQKIKPSGFKKTRLVIDGDFIMSNSMSFGRPYIVKAKGAIHDGWLLMREKIEKSDKDFFYYLLSSNYMYEQFSSKASGTTVKNLNINMVKTTNIPLPPLEEQKRIVSKLDRLFEKIDKAIALHQKNMDEANVFMASVLNEVFGELEEKYGLHKIKEIILKTKNKNPLDESDRSFTYIDISSVNNKTFKIEDPKYLLGKEAPSRAKKEVQTGDIVFATTRPNLKNIALVINDYENPIASTGFCVLRVNEKSINNFLFYYLMTNKLYEQIEPNIRGAQYPAISDKDLIDCFLPNAPLSIQQKVVDYLDSVSEKMEKVKTIQKEKMESLKALKASILDRAFRGEL
ncbi:MAG: hypothetical protein KN64_01330 [Sulfurovum sp. AS07-7]|nr:MAG: hypothetical protein KN64_01330 [Sulfurovum sp. AS07-7]